MRVAGVWTYLDRAVDSAGETIDFMLSPKRDAVSAKYFLQMALWRAGQARPRVINPAGVEASTSCGCGLLVGDTLDVSGMDGEDAAGKIPGTFEAEVKQAPDNIDAVLKAAGM